MRVFFGGDVFLGGDLAYEGMSPTIKVAEFSKADVRIIGLEQAISDCDTVADKCTLFTGSDAVIHLKRLGITAANVAQNHIHDKGEQGILDTLRHLDDAGIGRFGVGADISEARRPYWLTPDLAILGYCDYDRPYLKDVRVASDVYPGVNPLRYHVILDDLNRLPQNAKAILYFHWGREHVWLPPHSDIRLAKSLLELEKVVGVVGTHAHVMQGYINHSGKRAYMCLGNLLFPNFHIEPPTQIAYPATVPDDVTVTRHYHSVSKLTYKKWPLRNRLSLVLQYDTATGGFCHVPTVQHDSTLVVGTLSGAARRILLAWVELLALTYRAPLCVYKPLEHACTRLIYLSRHIAILMFRLRQNGLGWFVQKIRDRIVVRTKASQDAEP